MQFLLPAIVVWAYSFAVGAEASVVRAALMFTFAGVGSDHLSSGLIAECARRRRAGASDSQSERDLRSVFSTHILVSAGDRGDRVAAASKLFSDWRVASDAIDALPACVSAWTQKLLRSSVLERTEMAQELDRSSHSCRLFKTSLAAWLERYHLQRFLRYMFGAVVVSASVQLLLLPLMIFYFHRLSLASLLLNIVVSVLLAVLVGVALLALLISQVSADDISAIIQTFKCN